MKLETKLVIRPQFQIWKTIEVGTGIESFERLDSVATELNQERGEKAEIRFSENARETINQPTFVFFGRHRFLINLVRVSLHQLRLPNKTSRGQIYERAKFLGLKKCPHEVGFQLRIQYLDQPVGERLVIASDPVQGGQLDQAGKVKLESGQDIFLVDAENSRLWLRAAPGNITGLWDDEFDWIFAL